MPAEKTQPSSCQSTTPTPELSKFSWVVVNSSGGKDSQVALELTVEACKDQGFPLERVIVSHQDLGSSEWPETGALVEKQAGRHGLETITSRYRDKHGKEKSLLEYAADRGKWPSGKNRWCTSEYKRGPGNRTLTAISKRETGPILQVFGFRAEESPSRARKECMGCNLRASTLKKPVTDWLPAHTWTETQVWDKIKETGSPHHYSYDLGMARHSCQFCIFAPKAALMIAGMANPESLYIHCDLETNMGYTFQIDLSLNQIRDAIQKGETPEKNGQAGWKM